MTASIWSEILKGLGQTLEMTVLSTIFAYVAGLPLGVLLYSTSKGRIAENKAINAIAGTITNVFRSIPFLILLVFLIPFTRFIVGTSLGTTATIVPLTIGAIPIVARMVEQSLNEVPFGIIEAAESMGATDLQIIIHFLIPEAAPSLLNGAAINLATILGYSAMAGCIGGGGLGAIALNYGYYRYQTEVLIIAIIILIVIVQLFQESGIRISQKIRKF